MKKIIFRLVAIFLLMVSAIGSGAQEALLSPEEIEIVARKQEYDEAADAIVATGNVRVRHQDILLTADTARAELDTGDVTAEGNVVVLQGDRRLEGDRARYNLTTREGEVARARAQVGIIHGSGERILVFPSRLELYRGSFTACPRPEPEYHLTARKITLIPGQKVKAERVSIYLYKTRLLTLPSYSARLGAGGPRSPLPRLGYSSLSGLYLRNRLDITLGSGLPGSLEVRLSQRHGITGGLDLVSLFGSPAFFRAAIKEEETSRRVRNLLVDRLPEVGIRYGRPLPESDFRGFASGEISLGRYRERPTNLTALRASATLSARSPRILLGGDWSGWLGAELLQAIYDTGDAYTELRPMLDLGRTGSRWSWGVRYLDRLADGKTPFLFDEADIFRELRPRLEYARPGWRIGMQGRYDLERDNLYDLEVSYTRTLHCIEPSVTLRTRQRELGVGLRLIGLQ